MSGRYLIDTQVVMRWAFGEELPLKTKRTINHPDSELFLSSISLWEMTIKASKPGALNMPSFSAEKAHRMVTAGGTRILDLRVPHLEELHGLPWHHKDPFDRMLIAQAKAEGLTLIGADRVFTQYGVPVLWD